MFRGMVAVMYKESRHIIRDFRTLFFMLIIPALQLTIFGYGIDLDVRDIPTVVFNMDGRQASRELVDDFRNTGTFKIIEFVGSDEELMHAIVRGDAKVGLRIGADYSDRVLLGKPAQVQVLIDGSESSTAMQALNVSNALALRASVEVQSQQLNISPEQRIESRPRVLFNPDMRTANFMVPALVGIILQLVTMTLTAFAVVREKENGTLEQLMMTPVSRMGLMLGKLIPYGVVGIIEAATVLLLMIFLFNVPIAGSVFLLAGFMLIFMCTTLGLGLLISTVAENQNQALQMSTLVLLPSILLSGYIFPQDTMPGPIWAIGQIVPVTYFLRILRGIILRDASFADLWVNGAVLALMAVVLIGLASLRFRKTMA